MINVAKHYLMAVDEIRLKFLPHLCDFVSLFTQERHTELLKSLVSGRLDEEKGKRSSYAKVELLTNLFDAFPVTTLVDNDFHNYLFKMIKDDPYVQHRKDLAGVLGRKVVGALIKNKKYRKDLTDFVDLLRMSPNFRDR